MAYRLQSTDDLGGAIRAVALSQLDGALAALATDDGSVPSATDIHDARKRLKKLRSLVRLARPALGKKVAARENAALRDAGRLLAGTRDADVMLATTAKLAKRYVGHVPATTFEALETAFAAQAVAERTTADAGPSPAAQAHAAIAAVRERAESWPLDDLRRKALVGGLRRTYERGRDELAVVREDPETEVVHDWRKRVKDLWYQQRLLRDAWPEVLEAQAEEAHRLSELLGDDHDLAVLAERLAAGDVAVAADLEPVAELAGQRRAELQRDAIRLGGRLYAEPPKAFEQRIAGYVKAWVAEARDAAAPDAPPQP